MVLQFLPDGTRLPGRRGRPQKALLNAGGAQESSLYRCFVFPVEFHAELQYICNALRGQNRAIFARRQRCLPTLPAPGPIRRHFAVPVPNRLDESLLLHTR